MRTLLFLSLLMFYTLGNAQEILGEWNTFDDKTQQKKGLIKIYQQGDKYYGKIVKSYVKNSNSVCKKCEGDQKDKPIKGLVIIKNLVKDGDEYNQGTILDPENGKIYDCYLKLVGEDKLKVRGFLGVSLLGRTQYWKRAE